MCMSAAETSVSCSGTLTAFETLFMFLIFSFSPTSQDMELVSQFSKTCQQFKVHVFLVTVILVGLRGKKKLGSLVNPVSAVGEHKACKADGKNGKVGSGEEFFLHWVIKRPHSSE